MWEVEGYRSGWKCTAMRILVIAPSVHINYCFRYKRWNISVCHGVQEEVGGQGDVCVSLRLCGVCPTPDPPAPRPSPASPISRSLALSGDGSRSLFLLQRHQPSAGWDRGQAPAAGSLYVQDQGESGELCVSAPWDSSCVASVGEMFPGRLRIHCPTLYICVLLALIVSRGN